MADYTIDVVTPATSRDLLTLAEAKMMLGLTTSDPVQDEQLQFLITLFSEEIAERLNRHPTVTIGYEEVRETWRETLNGRLYLSHWPVKKVDVLSVSIGSNSELYPVTSYEIAEDSGKLSNINVGGAVSGMWNHPVVVHYKGGYNLPDEAPGPLKHAVVVLLREERIRSMQAQTAGMRQIRHKEASVSFFDPNTALKAASGGSGKSPALQSVESILTHYMRFQC